LFINLPKGVDVVGRLEISNNGKQLDLVANARGYGGGLVLSSRSQLALPVVSDINISLDSLYLAQLPENRALTGLLGATSNLQFTGKMLSDLDTGLTGKSVFTVRDGSLDVRPIKSMAQTIDRLMGKSSPISQWPDMMPFDQLNGEHVFSGSMKTGQVLNASLENLDITALGGVDLLQGTLSYDVTALFRQTRQDQFKVPDQLAGVRWPLTCEGRLDDSPAELCFGREGAVSQLVAEIARRNLKSRGKRKLGDLIREKLPEEYEKLADEFIQEIFN